LATKIKDKETPLMKQYNSIKAKHPGALLLFRVGDFYETFGEDAVVASKILGIVLTKRANGSASHIELAGFPHHSLDSYLPKLVRAGQRVAICDQLEDPKKTKKIVKRGVTELVTPGVSSNDHVLDTKKSNYLCAIYFEDNYCGCSFLDISTGEFLAAQGSFDYIDKLISGFKPSEIILSKNQKNYFDEKFGAGHYCHALDDFVFNEEYSRENLNRQFKTGTLKGFGIDDQNLAIVAAGACLQYLDQTHHHNTGHISSISRIEEDKYVWLDSFTIRNLELIHPLFAGGKSLLDIIDKTITPMGSRLIRKWMVLPLKSSEEVNRRLDVVEFFHKNKKLRKLLFDQLSEVGDLERLISKVSLQRINPREILQLLRSLKAVEAIKADLEKCDQPEVKGICQKLDPCASAIERIENEISPETPVLPNKGGVFSEGINEELDQLREIAFSGKDYLLNLKSRESERTGIPSLKIAYNNVFGYYLEVTNAHKDKVPPEWIRKQTLVNAERYITEELKEYEEKIMGAEEKIEALEMEMYRNFVLWLMDYLTPVLQNSVEIAKLDCLSSFAELAVQNKYYRPDVDESYELNLKQARHPVIEQQLPPGESYIPNDIYLNNEEQRLVILTGPNMSGKSAVLRQTAMAALMAQMGSFVACKEAKIGVVDKIYTRVGASDNISLGESTFMVEMIETASILNNISDRSLVLLDEIGRGTSTFDGVSLAWAIAEFLHNIDEKPKTLFATHYHELNELEDKFEGVKNYHVSILEENGEIVFRRKLKRGGSERSFGIHVARLAGVPQSVIVRSSELLRKLEKNRDNLSGNEVLKNDTGNIQLSMFQLEDPQMKEVTKILKKIDINSISPIDSLMKLNEIKNLLKDKK
jgi:DNA mismatch repair protein MutS